MFPPKARRLTPAATELPPGLVVSPGAALGTPAPIFDVAEMRAKNRVRASTMAQRNAAAAR
jgi:hypothetical protein